MVPEEFQKPPAKKVVTNLNVKKFRWFLLRWTVCAHVALSCVEARTPFLL